MGQEIHQNVRALILSAAEVFRLRGPVYQFGSSLGRTTDEVEPLHDCFPRTDYVTCEFDEGAALGRLPFPDGSAQTVLWVGALGRAFDTQGAVLELHRILAPGGVLLICTPAEGATGRGALGSSQLAARGVQRLLAPLQLTLLGWQGADGRPHTVYGLGFRPPVTGAILRGTSRFLESFQQRLKAAGGKIGWWRRWKALLGRWHGYSPGSGGRRVDCRVQFAMHMTPDRNLDEELLRAWLLDEKTGGRLDLMD